MSPQTVAVTGSTGLLGSALVRSLTADGVRVVRLVRDRQHAGDGAVYWDPASGDVDTAGLEGVDVAVHLAGHPFDKGRWTKRTKQRLHDSRVDGTSLLSEALASLSRPPRRLVSGSAVGFYGDRGAAEVTEDTPPGDDFLANLCVDWEQATSPAEHAGIEVVHARTGVVLAADGPLMSAVRLPFRLGVGGRIGSGRQFVPWISYTDHIRALRFLIDRDHAAGPFNLTSPEPVTNAGLTRALGRAFRRPAVLPIPLLAIRLLYGVRGVSLAAVSQRVLPTRLLAAGFTFIETDVDEALRAALAA